MLKSGMLNNNSEIVRQTVETMVKDASKKEATVWTIVGAPTEGALITLFEKSGLNRDAVKAEYRELREFSFDSAVKRMSKIFEHTNTAGNSELVVFTKGATEVLQNLCSRACIAGEIMPWDEEIAHFIISKVNKYANQGYRVLSFAYRFIDELPPEGDEARKDVESDLTYLGFVAILDPPRDGVLDAVLECERAGVMVVMITGDSPSTAHSIAQQLRITTENELVVEGRYIDQLTDEEFQRTAVFARVSPEHKQKIVERYQSRLHRIVAMTGDGVNDALALGMADAGIAMGITGTDVAKQAADMVISDDSFTSIAIGIKEGRGLFQKIRVIIYFYICANLFEGLLIFFASLLLPGNTTFLNYYGSQYIALMAHTLPPFSLVFDNMGEEVMDEKPRDSEEIFDRFVFKTLLFQALLLGIGCGLVYYICYIGYFPVYPNNLLGFFDPTIPMTLQKARTMYITTVMIAETLMVLSIRRFNKSVFRSIPENPFGFLYFMIGIMFFCHFALMYWPGVAPVVYNKIGFTFNLIWLTGSDWAVCVLLALPSFFGIELWKYFARKQRKFF
jgi:Ca2+-transporting ATPase